MIVGSINASDPSSVNISCVSHHDPFLRKICCTKFWSYSNLQFHF